MLKALERPVSVGNVPVEITSHKQQKSPLVVLGRIAVYCNDMGRLTEWIVRRKAGWEKDEPGAALGLGSHSCSEGPSGLPIGMNPLLTTSLL